MVDALAVLLAVWVLVVITPGPDFLVTVRYATAVSRRHGAMTALGVNFGLLVWVTGSILGLSVLMARVSWLYEIIRLAGAAYIIYLGVRMLWSSRRAARMAAAPTPSEPSPPASTGLFRAWRTGFLTDIANPKAVVFFGSLLGALLPPHPSVGFRVVVVGAIIGTSLVWYLIVAATFGSSPVVRVYRRIRHWIDRVTATVLIGLGVRLAVDH